MELPLAIKSAVEQLGHLPGIGPKSATRMALFLTHLPKGDREKFTASIEKLSQVIKCQECGLLTETNLCQVCADQERQDHGVLCVVESVADCLAIEKAGEFQGLFHILEGVLNPLLGVGPSEIGIDHLLSRIQQRGIKEVILAINPSVEGDATCSYIKAELPSAVVARRIGFGMPIGGHLEYMDSLTIAKALENRTSL